MQPDSDEKQPPPAQRIRDLFDRVIELPVSEHDAALREASATPFELDYLSKLLDADREVRPFFDTPAADWAKQLYDEPTDTAAMIGQFAGPYKLMEFLGKGGSAIVFRAERMIGETTQTVALKLLHNGLFSPDSRRRFRREQEILSRLSHPNIARLIDAGISEAGAPYIAMECIDGGDLISYANAHALNLTARLQILIELCRAVDAAHRALVVHRDLKPSNVFVTVDGHVKVLDFGIAKLLDEDETATATLHIALTPGYAAPEQYESGTVTTLVDVYSIGVIASELLTGERLGPDATKPTATASSRPTTTWRRRRQLDTDLTQILRATLASEPKRRYTSAGHLADDISRYLRDEPIQVVPVSGWYRMRKFVTRHRASAITAALLFLAILFGMVAVLWQASLVQAQAARANATRDFLISVFHSAGADLPRDKRPSVEAIVEQASTQLIADQSLPDAQRADLLITLVKVARSIGAYDRATGLLDQVDKTAAHAGTLDESTTLESRILRAQVLADTMHMPAVLELLQPIQSNLLKRGDKIAIGGLMILGRAECGTRREEEGLALMRQAVVLAEHAQSPELLLSTLIAEVQELIEAQRFREGLYRGNEAVALWHQQREPSTQALITLHFNMGLASEADGDIARAEKEYLDAIGLGERFFDKPNPATAMNVGMYGSFLNAQGRFAEAEPYLRRGLAMCQEVFGEADTRTLNAVAAVGRFYAGKGQALDSVEWFSKGVETCRANSLQITICARMLSMRARSYAKLERFEEANTDIRAALDQQRVLSGDSAPAYAWVLDNLLVIQIRQHDYAGALDTADHVLAINASVSGGMLQADLTTRFYRARALFELHRNDEALAEIMTIEPQFAKSFPAGILRIPIMALKAQVLSAARRRDESREVARQALELSQHQPGADAKLLADLRKLAEAAGQ